MRNFCFLLSLLIASHFTVLAQNDKIEVYNNFLETYGDLKSISFNFVSVDKQKMKGKFIAKKGNKYILETEGRKLFCDGKTIWNYSISQKNVMISDYDKLSRESSIEAVFFELIEQFAPSALSSESNTKSGSSLHLKLLPIEKKKKKSGINEIHIWLDKNTKKLKTVMIKGNGLDSKWNLTNINLNADYPDSKFNYKPGKNIEVIDLR